jgi:hypothetical protein
MCENQRENLPGEEAGNFPTGDFLLVAFLILQQYVTREKSKPE